MKRSRTKLATGPVTQMPHETLSAKIKVPLHALAIVALQLAAINKSLELCQLRAKQRTQRVHATCTSTKHVRLTEWHVQLGAADADAVLASVVLLLH